MIKSNAENNAIVFQREHKIPDDVRRDCPELTAFADTKIAEAVEAIRHGEDPVYADAQLRLALAEWAIEFRQSREQAQQPASGEPVYAA